MAAFLVQLCTISPDSGADLDVLSRIANRAFAERSKGAQALAKGMVAYRRRRFDEALTVLPRVYKEDTAISLGFRAMAYYESKRPETARQELELARQKMQSYEASGEEGRPLQPFGSFSPTTWCNTQIVLREAEALIEPGRPHDDGRDPTTTEEAKAAAERASRL